MRLTAIMLAMLALVVATCSPAAHVSFPPSSLVLLASFLLMLTSLKPSDPTPHSSLFTGSFSGQSQASSAAGHGSHRRQRLVSCDARQGRDGRSLQGEPHGSHVQGTRLWQDLQRMSDGQRVTAELLPGDRLVERVTDDMHADANGGECRVIRRSCCHQTINRCCSGAAMVTATAAFDGSVRPLHLHLVSRKRSTAAAAVGDTGTRCAVQQLSALVRVWQEVSHVKRDRRRVWQGNEAGRGWPWQWLSGTTGAAAAPVDVLHACKQA